MVDYIISVDAGNGGTNAVMAQSGGKYKSYYAPSYRASTDGQTLTMPGGIKVMEYEWIDWNGRKYVVGDTAMRLGSDDVETHRGDNRYGNEFHQMLVAHAVAQLGVKEGTVHLVLFCPPGIYETTKDLIKKRFMESPVDIRLSGDKKPRKWTYEQITVLPEGVGAAACILIDQNGVLVNSDVMAGRFLVLDGGAQTFDVIEFANGNVNPRVLKTYKNQGVIKHIIQPILTHYQKVYGYLNIGHVDSAIRRGLVTGDYILDPDNAAIDIKPTLMKLEADYAGWVANTVIDGDLDRADAYRRIMCIGGFENLCGSYMHGWYGDKLIDFKKVETLKKIDPVDVNAVGGLRFVLAQQKAR